MADFAIGVLDRILMAVRHAENAETKEYNESEKSKRLYPDNQIYRERRALASERLEKLESIKAMVVNIRKNTKEGIKDPTQSKKLEEAHKFLFGYESSKAKLELALKIMKEVDSFFSAKR